METVNTSHEMVLVCLKRPSQAKLPGALSPGVTETGEPNPEVIQVPISSCVEMRSGPRTSYVFAGSENLPRVLLGFK